ncbi:hypothetical protein, partial [Aeromonas caviae]|uniref:hypothetical protein n=1 Tax=Aeromonas caviae TaxID=648 RepID=UPI002B4778EE
IGLSYSLVKISTKCAPALGLRPVSGDNHIGTVIIINNTALNNHKLIFEIFSIVVILQKQVLAKPVRKTPLET